jgi:hypothetical protein
MGLDTKVAGFLPVASVCPLLYATASDSSGVGATRGVGYKRVIPPGSL